jgi:hypothetical protein
MKTQIPVFEDTAGWAVSDPSVTIDKNEINNYIAGLENTQSLIVYFPAGSNGRSVNKNPNIDITGNTDIGFHLWSREKKGFGNDHLKASDFRYSVAFTDASGTTEYLMPTGFDFSYFQYEIDLATLIDVKITCLHDDEDYLILSHLVAFCDEIPLDIFIGMRELLEYNINQSYSTSVKSVQGVDNKGLLIGQISSITSGDKSFTFPSKDNLNFIDSHSVIYIEDAAAPENNETHQVDSTDEVLYRLSSMYDGKSFVNSYTTANVYLRFAVDINPNEKEILLPGIMIWQLAPEPIFRDSDLENVRDSMKADGSVTERTTGQEYSYPVSLSCQSRHIETLIAMSNIVKNALNREEIWVNGKLVHIDFNEPSTYTPPVEAVNQIPLINWTANISIREELWKRVRLQPADPSKRSLSFSISPYQET